MLYWIVRVLLVKVIVTSYLFPAQKFSLQRLQTISSLVGKERLVVDIRYVLFLRVALNIWRKRKDSCRRRGDKWMVAMNKWQDITDTEVCRGTEKTSFCDELSMLICLH